ncbi:phenazine biosynthesis protein [Leptodontidium sp. MPI-SDFR-AT-0119]|nr:phenazine biosynthesis protein [Leptodontidium sp. MPI-SDFR-AT-0119]
MTTLPFVIVDVFSTTAFKGNPLAIVNNTTTDLSTAQQQFITRQFNLSETTFFSKPTLPKAAYKLRSFLPDGREVFGAGHNILGVWWWLAVGGFLDLSKPTSRDGKSGSDEFVFWQELGGEVLPVKILRKQTLGDGGTEITVSIRQAPPKAQNVHPDPASLAQSIGLSPSDIGFGGTSVSLQPQVFSTSSTRHLQVPISSISALNRTSVQRDKLLHQLSLVDDHAYGLYLFSPVPDAKGSYQARFFSPGMSGEDPATGSAAGPLSAYLHRYGQLDLVEGVGRIAVTQGLSVGRECLINVTLSDTGAADGQVLDVDFSGSGVKVATGDITVPDAQLSF